jgi:uncharacterized membrane protein
MANREDFGRPGAAGLPADCEAARPRGLAPPPHQAYQRRLPPYLSRLLERWPFLRRLPHPLLVHFPIVYMLAATFFSLLYLATGNRAFDATAFYCLGAGVLFLPPVMLTGLFTHWLNFPGEADKTIRIEIRLSSALLAVAAGAFLWRWLNPQVLHNLAGLNLIYLLLVVLVTPLVTATSYFGGMLTFPLEAEVRPPRLRKSERKGQVA